MFESVLETIRFALHQATLIPEIKQPIPSETPHPKSQIPISKQIEAKPPVQTRFNEIPIESEIKNQKPEIPNPPFASPSATLRINIQDKQSAICNLQSDIAQVPESPRVSPPSPIPSGFPELEPLAQLDETYILCRSGKDLLIIDQHAAHERILYDRLLPKLRNREPISQLLLFPATFELGIKESLMLEEYIPELRNYGFDLDHFGGDTYTLRSVPEFIGDMDYRQLILDIIDNLSTIGKRLPTEEIQERMATFLVCRSAVKAGDIQQYEEWKRLVLDLQRTTSPYTCPHGRPTIIRLSKEELEKRFKRT